MLALAVMIKTSTCCSTFTLAFLLFLFLTFDERITESVRGAARTRLADFLRNISVKSYLKTFLFADY